MKKQSKAIIPLILGTLSIGTFAVYGVGLIFGLLGFYINLKTSKNQLARILSLIGISFSIIFLGFYFFFIMFAKA